MACINITAFVRGEAPMDYSASVAELGNTAGADTWRAAKETAEESPMLKTEDELDAMRAWAKATGAWDAAEVAAMADTDLNALFIQLVSGDMREADITDDMSDEDWSEYQARAEEGQVSGAIYRADCGEDAGQIFYALEG